MSLSLRIVVAAAFFVILGQPFVHALPGRNSDREEKLITRLAAENNPGKKARLQLRLAKLKLKEADGAYRARDFAQGKELLRQYLGYVRDSWSTLQAVDDGIGKHLRAFKGLEIALREDDRFLGDLSRRVPYPANEYIRKVAKESGEVHNQVLEAIFPSGISPKARRKRLATPRSSMPGAPGDVKS
jgi:hypothetical protein